MTNVFRRGVLAELPPEVAALSGVAFMVAVGFGVVAPAIAPFAVQFGVSAAAASAVISAFALARLISAPFIGRLVNLAGERLLLATGIGIVAASSGLAGLSQSYWQLLLLRGIGGFGSIMFTVSSASLLFRVTPPALRGRAQGVYAGGFLVGSIAGPALGVVASWSLRAPFFLYAGTLLLAGALGLHSLRHSELAARQPQQASQITLADAFRQKDYRAALAATTSAQFSVIGVRSALIPLFVLGPMGLHAAWTYLAFFAVSIVSGVLLGPVGRYADQHSRLPLLAGGLIVGAVGLVVLPGLPTVAGLLIASILLGIAGAVLSVVPGALVGDVIGSQARGGTVVSAYQMAGDLGSVLGPLVAGLLADHFGYSWSFCVAAAVSVLPILLLKRPAPRPVVETAA